jgi:hypothetical protein
VSRELRPGEEIGETVGSSDVLLPATLDRPTPYDHMFRRMSPSEQLFANAKSDTAWKKGQIARNIMWATWRSGDGSAPVEQQRAMKWIEDQRAILLKAKMHWVEKGVDMNRVLSEVYTEPLNGDKRAQQTFEFARSVYGF